MKSIILHNKNTIKVIKSLSDTLFILHMHYFSFCFNFENFDP